MSKKRVPRPPQNKKKRSGCLAGWTTGDKDMLTELSQEMEEMGTDEGEGLQQGES